MLGFSFQEQMQGHAIRDGETFDRPFQFDLRVEAPRLFAFFRTVIAEAEGRVSLDGLARDAAARGTMELSPFEQKRIRYVFDFQGDDGQRYRFDGHKSIDMLKPIQTWTTLPGKVLRADGSEWGSATLRFSLKKHLGPLVSSFRLARHVNQPAHG
jgi:hypothetical protein